MATAMHLLCNFSSSEMQKKEVNFFWGTYSIVILVKFQQVRQYTI